MLDGLHVVYFGDFVVAVEGVFGGLEESLEGGVHEDVGQGLQLLPDVGHVIAPLGLNFIVHKFLEGKLLGLFLASVLLLQHINSSDLLDHAGYAL